MQQALSLMRNLYKPFIGVSIVLIALIFTGTTYVTADDAKIVRVGLYENQPKIFTDDQGKVAGFWPDIIEYIASKEGWKIDYKQGTWTECLKMLADNEIDIMPDVAFTEERARTYDFSQESVYTSWSRVYARDGAKVNSILDLSGKNVAVLRGSVNVDGQEGIKQLIKAYSIECTLTEVDSYSRVFELVNRGEADAAVVSKDFGNKFEKDFKVVRTAIIFQPSLLYFAFPKGSVVTAHLVQRIDYHIKSLKEDNNSIYYRSLEKWLGVKPDEKPVIPMWVIYTLIGIGVLVLLLAVGSLILRYQVRARTKSLTKEIIRRKTVEDTLRDSEQRLSSIFDTVGDVIFLLMIEPGGLYRFLSINPAFTRVTGLPMETVMGKTVNEIIPEPSLNMVLEKYCQAIREKTIVRWEETSDYPTGRLTGEVSIAPVYNDAGNCAYLVGTVHDITERKQSRLALEASEKRYRLLAENIVDVIWTCDMDYKFTFLSPSVMQLLGYDEDELMCHSVTEILTPESRENITAIIDKIRIQLSNPQSKTPMTGVYTAEARRKDGSTVWIEIKVSSLHNQDGKAIGSIGISRDITERRQADEQLRQSEQKYSTLVEQSNDGIIIIQDNLIKFANSKMVEVIGFSLEEASGRSFIDFVSPEYRELVIDHYAKRLLRAEIPNKYEVDILAKDGRKIPVELNASRIEYEGRPADMAIIRDITERKLKETQIRQLQEFLQLQIDQMPIGLIVWDVDFRVQTWNPAAGTIFGFTAQEAMGKHAYNLVVPMKAQPLVDDVWQRLLEENIPVNATNENITKDGRTIICQWLNVPLKKNDGSSPNILSMVQDITEMKRHTQKLLDSLRSTVHAMARTVEMRDPYTAGHQERVTKLAYAIGIEINIEQNELEGLQLASMIHDLGKIYVPAEILSKPGKLNEIEFSLIKMHPHVAYEILKGIEFPWPVADVVLQHHERMDGSGYPLGLRGESINFKARIIAVADVVEAMASHRPYRPALGIDKALEEISNNKGKLYDPDVVDACLRLFNHKGFKFD